MCQLSPLSLGEVIAMGSDGLLSCRCPVYLSYAWCKHSCAFALDRGIISTYPPTMHPKPSASQHMRGRPKKLRALDKDVIM